MLKVRLRRYSFWFKEICTSCQGANYGPLTIEMLKTHGKRHFLFMQEKIKVLPSLFFQIKSMKKGNWRICLPFYFVKPNRFFSTHPVQNADFSCSNAKTMTSLSVRDCSLIHIH